MQLLILLLQELHICIQLKNLKMHISQILNIMQKIIKQELRHMILLTIQLLQLINLLLIRF